jgi:hypothetical protein
MSDELKVGDCPICGRTDVPLRPYTIKGSSSLLHRIACDDKSACRAAYIERIAVATRQGRKP